MIVIACGGRDYRDQGRAFDALDAVHAEDPIGLLITGAARGADTIAMQWAAARGVFYVAVPALWDAHGNGAGPRRNAAMLRIGSLVAGGPPCVVAFPGGRGTAHMVRTAQAAGCRVHKVEQ